jgi:hypothetical protein
MSKLFHILGGAEPDVASSGDDTFHSLAVQQLDVQYCLVDQAVPAIWHSHAFKVSATLSTDHPIRVALDSLVAGRSENPAAAGPATHCIAFRKGEAATL